MKWNRSKRLLLNEWISRPNVYIYLSVSTSFFLSLSLLNRYGWGKMSCLAVINTSQSGRLRFIIFPNLSLVIHAVRNIPLVCLSRLSQPQHLIILSLPLLQQQESLSKSGHLIWYNLILIPSLVFPFDSPLEWMNEYHVIRKECSIMSSITSYLPATIWWIWVKETPTRIPVWRHHRLLWFPNHEWKSHVLVLFGHMFRWPWAQSHQGAIDRVALLSRDQSMQAEEERERKMRQAKRRNERG